MLTPQKNGSNGVETASPLDLLVTSKPSAGLVSSTPMVATVEVAGIRYTVTANVELVTPEMAAGWLARQNLNRKPTPRRVNAYARAMVRGDWLLTNQGIGLDVAGRLLDGGHRCEGVVKSGSPALMLVVRGLPPETQSVVDFNRVRSAADQGVMQADTNNSKSRLAAAHIIHLITAAWLDESEVWSPMERTRFAKQYEAELDWAAQAFGKSSNNRFAPSAVVGAWAYAYGATATVAEWVNSYLDGSGLDRGDPLLSLRNGILNKQKNTVIGRRTLALRTLRALWAKLQGEQLLKVFDTAEGAIGFMGLRGDDASKWEGWTSFTRTV